MWWAGNAACVGGRNSTYRVMVPIYVNKRDYSQDLGVDGMIIWKCILREITWEGVDWIHQAANTPYNAGKFFLRNYLLLEDCAQWSLWVSSRRVCSLTLQRLKFTWVVLKNSVCTSLTTNTSLHNKQQSADTVRIRSRNYGATCKTRSGGHCI